MKKAKIIFGGVSAIAVLWVGSQFLNKSKFSVFNESGQEISSLKVTVCGQTTSFNGIPPGSSTSGSFFIRGDDHFVVTGSLKNGTKVALEAGYVTNGFYSTEAKFIIKPDGKVELTQST